jgi:hypothetical protein
MTHAGVLAVAACCEVLGGRLDREMAEGEMTAREAGFTWTLLPRHGRRPVAFAGRELLRVDNSAAVRAGHCAEWSEIRVFELLQSGFVTAIRHLRAEDGLPCWQDASLSEDAAGVVETLRCHRPDMPGLGGQIMAWQDLLHAIFGLGSPQ